MFCNVSRLIRRCAAALSIGLLGQGAANAGLVTGSWDPIFDPTNVTLPNLSWQLRTEWLVPTGCSSLADGVYSTTLAGPCQSTISDPVRLVSIFIRWFDTNAGDPNDFYQHVNPISAHYGLCESVYATTHPTCGLSNVFTYLQGSEPLIASNVRVEQNQVVGFDALDSLNNPLTVFTFGWPTSAGNHQYDLSFTTNGPVFVCADCSPVITADTTDLTQFLVTYTSNDTTAPKFTNVDGRALGAVLNGAGAYQGQAPVVPEPGVLALVLAALAGLGFARRRQAA